jgi:hypothetical protein
MFLRFDLLRTQGSLHCQDRAKLSKLVPIFNVTFMLIAKPKISILVQSIFLFPNGNKF